MVHVLDDETTLKKHDPKGMYELTCAFPDQVKRAHEIASSIDLAGISKTPSSVLLTGLGGSAVGGDFVRAMFEEYSWVPFQVNRDYTLPHFVGKDTLVIICSYSGNTEETLSAYAHARQKGAQIVCVTSGGEIEKLAEENGHPCIKIPGGQPPRTALGFMLIPALVICEKLDLIPKQDYVGLIHELQKCVDIWSVGVLYNENPTKKLGQKLHGALGTIYGAGFWQGIVANRWKGQINENSKNMIFANAFPELNHNEILGWVKADGQGVAKWVTLVLEDGTESAKIKKRIEVTGELIHDQTEVHRIKAPGNTLLEKMLCLALMGDFVSLYLAALNEVDPEDIGGINHLKTSLANVP